ncbi:Protein tyrosine phosphatase type IVA 1 [Mactra antiquata]
MINIGMSTTPIMDEMFNTTNASMLDNGTFQYGGGTRMMFDPVIFKVYNIYLYLIIAIGVPENVLVLIVFACHRPSTTTDWFIISITICDLISFVVNVPVYVTFTNGSWLNYGTTTICRLHMFISQSLVLSSSFYISGLALDRYMKVCRQMTSYSITKARNGCVIILVLTSLLSIPCFTMYENTYGRCVSRVMDLNLFLYYLMVFFTFVLAISSVLFAYIKVTRTVIKSETNIKKHKNLFGRNRVVPVSLNQSSGLFKDTVYKAGTHVSTTSSHKMTSQDISKETIAIPNTEISAISFEPSSCGTPADGGKLQLPRVPLPRETRRGQNVQNSSTRTTKIAFCVCVVFILSWIPPWVSFFLATIPSMRTNIQVIQFMMFGRMTYLINGVANPILYTWLNRKFREYIRQAFCLGKR